MLGRSDQHVRMGADGALLDRQIARRTSGQRDLHFVASQRLNHGVAVADLKSQVEFRPAADESCYEPRGEIFRRRHRADGKPTPVSAADRLNGVSEMAHRALDAERGFERRLSRGRQAHSSRRSIEEPERDCSLEALHAGGQRRRRHMEHRSGLDERARRGDCLQRLDVPKREISHR